MRFFILLVLSPMPIRFGLAKLDRVLMQDLVVVASAEVRRDESWG